MIDKKYIAPNITIDKLPNGNFVAYLNSGNKPLELGEFSDDDEFLEIQKKIVNNK